MSLRALSFSTKHRIVGWGSISILPVQSLEFWAYCLGTFRKREGSMSRSFLALRDLLHNYIVSI